MERCWGFAEFKVQVIDVIDCFELLEPKRQIAIEAGHSVGHAKYLHLRACTCVMTKEYLGPGNPPIYLNGEKWSTNFVPELTTRILD